MKEGGQSTHEQGERVKIPLLPYKVGKSSGTMVTTLCMKLYLLCSLKVWQMSKRVAHVDDCIKAFTNQVLNVFRQS